MSEDQITARRLVGALEPLELQVLVALVRGMSVNDTAAVTGRTIDEVERARTSMMKKLRATRAADAVRIGLHARLEMPG